MEVQLSPNALDEPNLLYKLQRKIKVFNTTDSLPNRGYGLVATSSQHGLVFIASPDGTLSVYYLKQLVDRECESPQHTTVKLQDKPTHIAVNCDQTILAVLSAGLLFFYQVASFENKNATPFLSLKADVESSAFVSSLQWNPCAPDQIAVAYFNGVLLVAQVHAKSVKKVQSKARCICWSPKGKQLVTGNSDGSLCQFKPDLTLAKTLPAPNLFEGAAVEAAAIYWISTYQFAVVFKNATDNSRPAVTIVNTPKGGQMTCLNYEDVCYSMGPSRPWYYYLQGIPQWNLILASSSNSMEIATLGSSDGASWIQWCQSDEARPELPLTDKKQENFPVGLCVDTCAIHQLPWGENETLPPMPLLLVLSQTGLLTVFNIINLNKEAPQICAPPQQINLNPADLTSEIPGENAVAVSATPIKPADAQPKKSLFGVAAQPAGQKPSWATAGAQQGATGQPAAAPTRGALQQHLPPAYAQTPSSIANGLTPQIEIKSAYPQPVQAQTAAPQPAQPKQTTQPKPATQAKPAEPSPEVTAQLKAEQERAAALKANEELKKMLVSEVNAFQNELYKFKLKAFEMQTAANQDLSYLNSILNRESEEPGDNLQTLTEEHLRKEWSVEELRAAVVQLKLDLVRTCAVVAEARTHSEVKDAQWTQTDPLSTKRLASVKKLAYYVQNQLEQAHRALDLKWNEIEGGTTKYGQQMIRPILDDVYQPLVKQQEILSRQEAVLKTLKKTLSECNESPMFKSTSLLRSTPFKKDPLSKLTKNILNMSIEPDLNKAKETATARKLDALREMLANHKTTRVKHVEIGQHLAAMRLNYEKSVKERAAASATETYTVRDAEPVQEPVQINYSSQKYFAQQPVPQQKEVQPASAPKPAQQQLQQQQHKQQQQKQQVQPNAYFSPVPNNQPTAFTNVARTLFTDEPAHQPQAQKAQPATSSQLPSPVPKPTPTPAFSFTVPASHHPPQPPQSASLTTRSALKDLLQSKSQLNEPKSAANTFMGQNICSPTSFAASPPISAAPAPASQPISDIASMLNKYQPKSSSGIQEPSKILQQTNTNINLKSAETGEPEGSGVVTIIDRPKEKLPQFSSKPSATNTQNIPTPTYSFGKIDGITKLDKVKENIQEKATVKEGDKKENSAPKPQVLQASKPSSFPAIEAALNSAPAAPIAEKPIHVPSPETVNVVPSKPESSRSTASSLFANANAAASEQKSPSDLQSPASSTAATVFGSSQAAAADATSPAASIFSSAAAKASTAFGTPSESPSTQPASTSIFGASPSTASSIFASAVSVSGKTSVTTTQSSMFGTSSAQSVFASAAKPSGFSTPTPASPSSVFGTATTTQSVFGSTAPTTQTSVFGSAVTSQASIFGKPTSPTSVFGNATVATTAQASVFGTTTATTQASIFGAPTSIFSSPAASTQASVFGTATPSTQASVFGTPNTQASVFGTPANPTTQASVFGTPTTTQASVFGTPTTTQASVFGTPTTTQASVFGTPTPATQASVFGTSTPTSQPSVFGTPTATTQPSVFGTPTTQTSVFGTPTTTQSGGSLFGGAESSLFAAASISTTSAPNQPTGSIFGGGSPSSVFGAANATTNVFGSKSAFGQASPAASIFGGGGATSFAQKPASNFWGANTAGSGSTFGASAFGQTTTTQASIFGGGGSFSAPSNAPAFAAPPQGSVFGTTQPAAAPAFGGSPKFGSKPAFGQSAGFGSPSGFGQAAFGGGGFGGGAPGAFGSGATFGGGATFGSTSPGKVFGGATAAPSFGSPTQSNATFESLATQNTMTFGNLAQQSPQQPQPQPTFNTSPSFTGWRG